MAIFIKKNSAMKLLGLSLFITLLVCSCGGGPVDDGEPKEISEERKGQMDEFRQKLGKIEALLPTDSIIALGDSSIIDGLKNELQNDIQLFSIDRPLLLDIIDGGKNIKALQKNKKAWLYQGNWDALSVDPIREGLMYDRRLRNTLDDLNAAKYLVVTQDSYYEAGEVEGTTILKPTEAGVWVWLIDLKAEEIVRCVLIEEVTGSTVYTTRSGSNALESNIKTAIKMQINALMNLWGACDNIDNFKSSI
jgi:hypothetical protein